MWWWLGAGALVVVYMVVVINGPDVASANSREQLLKIADEWVGGWFEESGLPATWSASRCTRQTVESAVFVVVSVALSVALLVVRSGVGGSREIPVPLYRV